MSKVDPNDTSADWGPVHADYLPLRAPKNLTPQDEVDEWLDPRFAPLMAGTPGSKGAQELRAFLQNPPRDVLEELSARDPELARKLNSERVKEACETFARSTPEYYATDKNSDALVQHLASTLLKKTWLSIDDAQDELVAEGQFTAENLKSAYRALKVAGKLQVKPGTTKALSREEQRDVCAVISTDGPEAAILQYLSYAVGSLPTHLISPREFVVKHGAVCSRAALFVWQNSRSWAPSAEWDEFLAARTKARSATLTVAFLDSVWQEFNKANGTNHPGLAAKVPASNEADPAPPRIEDLSDVEVASLLGQVRQERARTTTSERLRSFLGS